MLAFHVVEAGYSTRISSEFLLTEPGQPENAYHFYLARTIRGSALNSSYLACALSISTSSLWALSRHLPSRLSGSTLQPAVASQADVTYPVCAPIPEFCR
jgi:hypothetical protein